MAFEELALSLLMLQAKPRLVDGMLIFFFFAYPKPRNLNSLLIWVYKVHFLNELKIRKV